ncbi:hypothetical protein ACTORR_10925 [Pseudomonas sp. SAR267]|uniref:hypothetical protein n=1 Tax=Pseudomonas TaxID=286 RepID=UPI003AB0E432
MPIEMHRHGNKAVPVGFTEMHRHANKAVPVGGTGVIGPKQMWERACPRCAARAALDLIGAAQLSAYKKRALKSRLVAGFSGTVPTNLW